MGKMGSDIDDNKVGGGKFDGKNKRLTLIT